MSTGPISALSFCSEYSDSIPRDFTLRYDPYTQCVKVLDNEQELKELAKDLRQQMKLLSQSLDRVFT